MAVVIALLPAVALADTLRGRVTDPGGAPIAGVDVLVFRAFTLVATLTTDADGRYGPQALKAGTYDVVLVAAGFVAAPVAVVVGQGSAVLEQNITATPLPASEYVVVTAPPLGADALWSLTRHLTVFDRADVVRLQAVSLADILRVVPGLELRSTGGPGTATVLSAWGGDTADVLIVIDGVPQPLFGGRVDPGDISAVDIERVEVERGLDSVAFGVRAASAIVRVSTLASPANRAEVTLEGGLEPSGRLSAAFAKGSRAWKWNGSGEWLGTEGQRGRRTASGATVANDSATRQSVSGAAMWQPKADRFIRGQGRVQHIARGNPGPWGSDPLGLGPVVDELSRTDSHVETASLSAMMPALVVSQHRFDLSFVRWSSETTGAGAPQEISTRRLQLRYHIDRSMSATATVSLGAEREWEYALDSLVRNTAGAPVALRRSFASYYIEAQQSFGARLFLSGNVRYDLLQRRPLDGNATPDAFRPDLDREVRHLFNGRVSAAAVAYRGSGGGSLVLRAKAGTAIHPPTAQDIGFSENPGLRPEHSESVAGGFEATLPGGLAAITVEGFHYHFDNLIVPFVLQRDHVRRVGVDNIGSSRVRGLTTGVRLSLVRRVVINGSMTWLDTRVLDADCQCDPGTTSLPLSAGARLVRRPRLAGTASVVWTGAPLSAFVTMGGRGPMLDIEPSRGEQLFGNPGFLTVKAGADVALGRPGVQVFARVTNLLDRRYEEVLGYPAPRRTLVIGLRLSAR